MSDVVDRGAAWAVVGAGPHGLSALKNLLELGLEADGFERDTDLGGNWNFHAENSRVYESTHLISTKPFTQFPDFPMPDAYPDYPSHWQVHRYFRSYAEHFGLFDHLSFNSEVVGITPAPADRWDVTVLDRASGVTTTRQYAGVVVANGHNWWPKIPQYPGQDTFTGEIKHSAHYKSADVVRGKRVLVVGAGNTGCDVAVESAQNAKETYHSTRRGYYYNPKYAMGRPSDQTADLLLALKRATPGLRLTLGVSTFVPKAHTPFQWQGVRPEAEKRLKQLGKRLKPKGIELRPESYGWSVIQALLSRSDRRLAPVIAAARGRHDSLGGWKQAYRQSEAVPALPSWEAVVHATWGAQQVLPWEHLQGPLPATTLRQHHDQALG